jgi:hypothetical protein
LRVQRAQDTRPCLLVERFHEAHLVRRAPAM